MTVPPWRCERPTFEQREQNSPHRPEVKMQHDIEPDRVLVGCHLQFRKLASGLVRNGHSIEPNLIAIGQDFPEDCLNLAQDLREAPWISRVFAHFLPS
jgi:hypothetical protein